MKKPKFKFDEITLVLIVAVLAIVVSVFDKINNSPVKEAEEITGLITDEPLFLSFINLSVFCYW